MNYYKPTGFLLIYVLLVSCNTSLVLTGNSDIEKHSKIYDAIIVPGFPYSETGDNSLIQKRVLWSQTLLSRGMSKNIIFSGSAVYSPYVEAEIMALYALELGVDENNIIIEPQAEYSIENLYYSLNLAKKHGFVSLALATDPIQAKKMQSIVKKYQLNIDIIPFDTFITGKEIEKIEINNNLAYISNFESIIERKNIIERIQGTKGVGIDFETTASSD